jgi:hypothetical protein
MALARKGRLEPKGLARSRKAARHWQDLRNGSPQARIGQYREGKPGSRGILPHGDKRQYDARNLDVIVVWLRIPRGCFVLAGKPDHKPDNGRGQKRYFEDAVAAPFDLAQDHWMTTGDQAAASGFNADAVIAHEPCEKARVFGGRDQGECQTAFTGSGWPENEHAGFPDHDGACMEMGFFRIRGRSIPFRGQVLSCLRQEYQEAGAEHRGQAVSARGTDPVERRYASAMGLDDLARDGKPKVCPNPWPGRSV